MRLSAGWVWIFIPSFLDDLTFEIVIDIFKLCFLQQNPSTKGEEIF